MFECNLFKMDPAYLHLLDNTSPVFDPCPSNISLDTSAGVATRIVDWTVAVTDNSGFVTSTPTHNPNDTFSIGTTEVTYTASDSSGNVADCSFFVTISGM